MKEKDLNSRKVFFTAYYTKDGHRVTTALKNGIDRIINVREFKGYSEFTTDCNEEILVANVLCEDGEFYLVPTEFTKHL